MHLQALAGNAAVTELIGRLASPGPARARGSVLQVSRFGSREHEQLGSAASSNATLDITLDDGSKLTYGEMVALAGDYFESMDQVRKLLESDAGKQQIRYARFWALHTGSDAGIDKNTKKAVEDRYYELAARNVSHFSQGGTASASYTAAHNQALWLAFQGSALCNLTMDRDAMATEAFSNHYLSDMFAAGHVRTPRQEMKEWYTEKYPDSVDQFVSYIADRVTKIIDSYGEPVWFRVWGWGIGPRNWIVRRVVAGMVSDLGGAALQGFSLGDLVSLAYHNQDNKGLNVVSDVDKHGVEVPGGYHWRGVGDGHLDESPDTKDMAVAAMRDSIAELQEAREAGLKAGYKLAGLPPRDFADGLLPLFLISRYNQGPLKALRYVPKEDSANPDRPNPIMNWHWGQLDPLLRASLDDAVRNDVMSALRAKAGGIGDADGVVHKAGMTIHARQAVLQFCDDDLSRGTAAIEEAMETPASGVVEASAPVDAGTPSAGAPSGGTPGPSDAGVVPAGVQD